MSAAKVIPVAPVNPSVSSSSPLEPTPSIVNLIGQGSKPNDGEGVYTSVSDPAKHGSEAATVPKDWTIHRPATEKVEDPPPIPISKVLLEHIQTMWTAGASAIQVEQVKNQLNMSQPAPTVVPGVIASEVFTYTPSKINKTEKP